ncbi:hypothetical protein [Dokdonella sp.]|uniref:hypothetical protein n=1 Tax=Dokdonella sp. TaxID=2291710 RepID=UPI001B005C1F|nr:hypothetical protein [Dokdonella sp.]MBO9662903.1 sel1 repeat family protein [Dokdonella sp.]
MNKPGFRLLSLGLLLMTLNAAAEVPSEPDFEAVLRRDYYEMLQRSDEALRDEKNPNAFALQQRLACAGNQPNQAALGGLYLAGRGATKDDLTGYAWLKLAAASGEPKYVKLSDALENAMTPEQRTLADAKVSKLKSLYAPVPTHMNCSQVKLRGSHRTELRCEPEKSTEKRDYVWLRRCESDAKN